MKISASVKNSQGEHQVNLRTDDRLHSIEIPPRHTGFGSSANGGELLFLALATCYCNDLYREAAKKGIVIDQVEVEVHGDFLVEGGPASNVTYQARVKAQASDSELHELMAYTDRVSEIQNTLRAGIPVTLTSVEIDQ